MELVDRKTAGLFAACARLGAVVAGAADEAELGSRDYAWNLGMAFQLIDDVLDFTARETVLGKAGGQRPPGRESHASADLCAAGMSTDERLLVETVLRDRSYSTVPFRSVLDLIERNGGIARARERAISFADKARAAMAEFPESPFQRALAAVTDLVMKREF